MIETLLGSLLELAHATSQNLGFVHRDGVNVSYGEETITETNLLELHRRHPSMVRLISFGKKQEALNGADWEWHIIGRARELRMRVQAKRVQRDNKLKIPHKVASSGDQQIDLLIKDAKAHSLKPIYCVYASEFQRSIWQKGIPFEGWNEFEYGCLLVSAHKVKAKMPKALDAIESDCIPWHYLVKQERFWEQKLPFPIDEATFSFIRTKSMHPGLHVLADAAPLEEFPTLDELNAGDRPKRELDGVVEAGSSDYRRRMSDEAYVKRGIRKLIQIDVSNIPRDIH